MKLMLMWVWKLSIFTTPIYVTNLEYVGKWMDEWMPTIYAIILEIAQASPRFKDLMQSSSHHFICVCQVSWVVVPQKCTSWKRMIILRETRGPLLLLLHHESHQSWIYVTWHSCYCLLLWHQWKCGKYWCRNCMFNAAAVMCPGWDPAAIG